MKALQKNNLLLHDSTINPVLGAQKLVLSAVLHALLLFLSVPPKALFIDQPVNLYLPGTLKTTPPWSTRDWLQRALEDMTVVAMEKVPMATEIRTSKTLRPSETQRKTCKEHEQRGDEQRFYNPITSTLPRRDTTDDNSNKNKMVLTTLDTFAINNAS